MPRQLNALTALLVLVCSSVLLAHVTVQPRESKAGAVERYAIRVPTEGAVTTTSVDLEVPEGVVVVDIEAAENATFETRRQGERIVAITWKKEIKPRDVAQFFFRARNPQASQNLIWKAHQHFADGSVADWVGPAGDRRPASVTTLKLASREEPK